MVGNKLENLEMFEKSENKENLNESLEESDNLRFVTETTDKNYNFQTNILVNNFLPRSNSMVTEDVKKNCIFKFFGCDFRFDINELKNHLKLFDTSHKEMIFNFLQQFKSQQISETFLDRGVCEQIGERTSTLQLSFSNDEKENKNESKSLFKNSHFVEGSTLPNLIQKENIPPLNFKLTGNKTEKNKQLDNIEQTEIVEKIDKFEIGTTNRDTKENELNQDLILNKKTQRTNFQIEHTNKMVLPRFKNETQVSNMSQVFNISKIIERKSKKTNFKLTEEEKNCEILKNEISPNEINYEHDRRNSKFKFKVDNQNKLRKFSINSLNSKNDPSEDVSNKNLAKHNSFLISKGLAVDNEKIIVSNSESFYKFILIDKKINRSSNKYKWIVEFSLNKIDEAFIAYGIIMKKENDCDLKYLEYSPCGLFTISNKGVLSHNNSSFKNNTVIPDYPLITSYKSIALEYDPMKKELVIEVNQNSWKIPTVFAIEKDSNLYPCVVLKNRGDYIKVLDNN